MCDNNKKKDFNEALAALVEFATASGNTVSKDTIHEYFKHLIDTEEQYRLIYQYLTNAKIIVENYTPAPDEANATEDVSSKAPEDAFTRKAVTESNQAQFFYEMYLDELHTILPSDTTTRSRLFSDFISGDESVVHRLSENYLPLVIELADKYENYGLAHSELVAEGNLALYECILQYPSLSKGPDLDIFEKHLCQYIEKAIKNAINEEIGSNRISDHLTDQINALNDASTELAKELNREPTLEELCKYLSLGEEEVKELMKVSINALSVIQTEE